MNKEKIQLLVGWLAIAISIALASFGMGFLYGVGHVVGPQKIEKLLAASFETQYGKNPGACGFPVGPAVLERWLELRRAFMQGTAEGIHPSYAGKEIKRAALQGKIEKNLISEVTAFSWTAPIKIAASQGFSPAELVELSRRYPTLF